MPEFSVHGKRFYPEPQVSFPRLEKPPSPVNFSLPALTCSLPPQTPPPVRPMTAPPNLTNPRANKSTVPLPGVPHLANYMLNNRVPFEDISGSIATDISLSKCRSSKDLIEAAKQYNDELSIEQIAKICNLRDQVFQHGGAFVFTPEQFVQFYGFYNMFLTEERSWEPRLSEKFYNSSRTRLRCSCRWSPRLNKRARTSEDLKTKHKCSAVYDMSFWPLHKLVIWECVESPNHLMSVNATISNCQYMENLVQKMKIFSAQDIEIILKAQLAPLSTRLFLEYLDCDRVRTLLRSKEDPTKSREPDLLVDLQLAEKLTTKSASPDNYTRLVDLDKDTPALIMLHKEIFRSMFYSDSITIGTSYRVSIHFDKISAITFTNSDGRLGATVFLQFDETNAHFGNLLHECLKQIEEIGYEICGTYKSSFVGLANIRKVKVSMESQTKIEHLNREIHNIEERWMRSLKTYQFQFADITRFDREVPDPEIAAMLRDAYSSPTVRQGEDILLEAIKLCESRNNISLESYLRTQFQYYHKWGAHKSHWAVEIDGDNDTSERYHEVYDPPFNVKHSMAATAVQFASWLSYASQIRPKPVIRSRIALSSVLCSPPASDDY